MLLKRGTGSGEQGTEVWERVVSGNLLKNPIWPMIDERELSLFYLNYMLMRCLK